jgi:hypothetical protein
MLGCGADSNSSGQDQLVGSCESSDEPASSVKRKEINTCEISSSHGGEYDVQSCLLGCTAM